MDKTFESTREGGAYRPGNHLRRKQEAIVYGDMIKSKRSTDGSRKEGEVATNAEEDNTHPDKEHGLTRQNTRVESQRKDGHYSREQDKGKLVRDTVSNQSPNDPTKEVEDGSYGANSS